MPTIEEYQEHLDSYDPDRVIACAIWQIEDVQGLNPTITDEEAEDIIESVDNNHDATLGITWDTFNYYIDQTLCSRFSGLEGKLRKLLWELEHEVSFFYDEAECKLEDLSSLITDYYATYYVHDPLTHTGANLYERIGMCTYGISKQDFARFMLGRSHIN